MAKILSFLSWNVENFHNQKERVDRVVQLIADHNPDVLGLYEVKGKDVFAAMVAKMPNYVFSITESPGVPEILVGIRNGLSGFVTQKDELQSKVPTLRPGALVTITLGNEGYSFLFLHLKSFPDPRSWGLRDDMFAHVAKLKRAIDKRLPRGEKANFIALGDVNTMGMRPAYNDQLDIIGAQELSFVDQRMSAAVNAMRRLSKTHDETWWGGGDTPPSDLDHAFAADHLKLRSFGGAELKVVGWVDKRTAAEKCKWISDYSDHSLLYGEIV